MKKISKLFFVCCLVLSMIVQLFPMQISAAEQKEEDSDVILSYKTHFDIGFTDYAKNVMQKYRTTFIDGALDSIDKSSTLPKEEQFKWTLPGWPLAKIRENWLGQTDERLNRIKKAIKDERILVHALPFTIESESMDLESIVRSLRYSSEISKEFGKELPIAGKMTDVPSQSWALPTILNHAGIKFLHLGCNGGSTPPDVPPLFWWEGPDGSRVLVMYSKGYGAGTLPPTDWPYDYWLGLKMTGDNAGPPSIEDVEKDINEIKNSGKTYKIGSMDDFAKSILKSDTSKIPVIRGDMPDTWIHGIMAAPTETKISRNIRPKIYQLDSLNTILNYLGQSNLNVNNVVSDAYEDALRFGEHTWGFNEHIEEYGETFKANKLTDRYNTIESSWDEKGSLVYDMQAKIIPALKKNMKVLADSINIDKERIVVYNALPWERDGIVEVEFNGKAPTSLINIETEEEVAVDVIKDGVLRFTAKDIPSMGYATYVFSNKVVDDKKVILNQNQNIMENEYFKITLDPVNGSISSIYDKKLNREMIDTENQKYSFSQYLNERFSNDEVRSFNETYNTQNGNWVYDDFGKSGLNTEEYKNVKHENSIAQNLEISYEQNANSVTAIMKGASVDNRYNGMALKITLYGDQNYIDIDWEVEGKVADPWPMADWLTFPFAIKNPEYRLYRLGGVMNPAKDIVKDSGVNNFALDGGLMIVDDDGKGIGMCSNDAPLVSIGKPGIWKFEEKFEPEEPTVFLNLFNNQWDTNYPTWNGGNWSTNVRLWSVDSMDYESNLVTPSKEARVSLLASYSNEKNGKLPANKEGIKLSKKGIEVTSFGPNIDGDGTILRLWEQSGKKQKVTLTFPKEMKVTNVTPVNLRGQQIGKAIRVKNNQIDIEIEKNAPYSLLIDYDIASVEVDDVKNVQVKNIDELGNIEISWENVKDDSYKVQITYTTEYGDGNIVEVDASDEKINISGLKTGNNYRINVRSKDEGGNLSKGVKVVHKTSGDSVIHVENVTSTESYNKKSPFDLINGFGLLGSSPKTATHDNNRNANTMWYSAKNVAKPWIQFDFGEIKSLDKMYVWNLNQVNDTTDNTNRGFKNVKIEYSLDGKKWTAIDAPKDIEYLENADVNYPFQFAKASGKDNMSATNLNTKDHRPLDFHGVMARYIKVTPKDAWGSKNYWGLSEVMFTENEFDYSLIKQFETTHITTPVGEIPSLPKKVIAELNDGSSKELFVEWNEITKEEVSKPHDFQIEGKVYGTEIKAYCTIKVKNKLESNQKVWNVKLDEVNNTFMLTWDEPDVDFEKVIVKYQNAYEIITEELEKGEKKLEINHTLPGLDYRFDICLKDEFGHVSDCETVYGNTSGEPEVNILNVSANSEWGNAIVIENIINKSGISGFNVENYKHDNNGDGKTMWHTGKNAPKEIKIHFDFGSVRLLDKLYVWNINQYKEGSDNTNRGLKNIKIEYSVDGNEWISLKAPDGIIYNDPTSTEDYPFQLAKASGENGVFATNLNTANHEPISFGGAAARYVRITPKDNWGNKYMGLSEVVFTQQNGGNLVSAENIKVETTKGKTVELPAFTDVIYDNGRVDKKAVIWDAFDSSLFNKEGEFSVKGKVYGTDLEIECKVIVQKVSTINKTELLRFIDVVTGKVEIAYSAKSWEALMVVFEKANAVFDNIDAKQEEVDAVCEELKAAIEQLELIISPEVLAELFNKATELIETADVFTGEEGYEGQVSSKDYNAFMDAVDTLRNKYVEVMQDIDPNNITEYDKGQMAEIANALEEAMDAFNKAKVHIDFTELDKLLEQANQLEESKYTASSWDALESVLKEIEELTADRSKVKQSLVDELTKRLADAMNALVEGCDWSELEPSTPVDPTKPVDPENPGNGGSADGEGTDTGDTSNATAMAGLMLLAGAVIVSRRRKALK